MSKHIIVKNRDGSFCVYGKYHGRPYCAHALTEAAARREANTLRAEIIERVNREKIVQFPRRKPRLQPLPTGPGAA